ncbi:MAG: hypothetical protein IKH75_20020, partial [Ruminococcus sp.]|nr:hypothetical protein [Ruminococcus sp.]
TTYIVSCHDDTSFVILVWLADHNYFNIGGLFFLLIAKAFLNPQLNWGLSEANKDGFPITGKPSYYILILHI